MTPRIEMTLPNEMTKKKAFASQGEMAASQDGMNCESIPLVMEDASHHDEEQGKGVKKGATLGVVIVCGG